MDRKVLLAGGAALVLALMVTSYLVMRPGPTAPPAVPALPEPAAPQLPVPAGRSDRCA